ncbi:MAG: S26 family signal peptidase [Haloferacaceae archaeon]
MRAGDGRSPREGAADDSFLTRVRTAESGPLFVAREVLTSVLTVAAVGLLLFAISGVWPPMVAVESGSMEPHMTKGDLVFITEPGRFAPDAAVQNTGVVPFDVAEGTGYRQFGSYGTVIVYDSPQWHGPPVIHRARFWVSDGENWYDEANPNYVGGADNCEEMPYCPAPHAGFITKGDANPAYDQVSGISSPVQPAWIVGIARLRVPWLGWIRLIFSGQAMAVSTGHATLGMGQGLGGAIHAGQAAGAGSAAFARAT